MPDRKLATRRFSRLLQTSIVAGAAAATPFAAHAQSFRLEEASIADVHGAIARKELSATQLVEGYLKRIAAYNGTCVKGAVDPATGFQLGDIQGIEKAGQLNALTTLNIRGKRSKTDPADSDPSMPDALDAAKALDEEFAKTGKLRGPLHGIPFAIKDQFDTRDLRSTSGAAVPYANDRPPKDAEIVTRLKNAGAIILAKANMGEYASGDRSTYGGTTCNPYDTSRSAGRSSGGSGAAVAANLVMCAIGEETGPSARNPAANNSVVGIVATHSLVSRAGIIPASSTRDRPGVLCRSVKDAATVLDALAGYDPKDPATAATVGHTPDRAYASFADDASLKGLRIGVIREFMQPFTKADEDSIRIGNQAIADLAKAGAEIVDPGPTGSLFRDAIVELVPSLGLSHLTGTFRDIFPAGTPTLPKTLELLSQPAKLPAEQILRILAERDLQAPGEGQFLLERYLQERGDKNIRSVNDLISQATFYNHAPIDGVTATPKGRLEGLLVQTQRFTKVGDGTPLEQKRPINSLEVEGWHSLRTVLQMIVDKVMADHRLDALVYPTKTIPAPKLAHPVEPANLKVIKERVTTTVDGAEYERMIDRVVDQRGPLTWRLSPNGGFPTIVVPAGFTAEVYDRAAVPGPNGAKKAGELEGPKAIELPVSIDVLGRNYSESTLIRIAAAYEQATRHRRAPKDFPPLGASR